MVNYNPNVFTASFKNYAYHTSICPVIVEFLFSRISCLFLFELLCSVLLYRSTRDNLLCWFTAVAFKKFLVITSS